MDPITGAALLTGGASLLGGFLSNQANASNTAAANRTNANIATEQMKFQRYMSDTSYQRGTADMKAAGLNPMLAYMQGGASTPQGAGIAAQAAEYKDPITPALSTALETRRLSKEIQAVGSQVALNDQMAKTANAQMKLNENNARVAEINAKTAAAQLPAVQQRASLDTKRDKIDEKMLGLDSVTKRVSEGIGIINGAKSVITPKYQWPAPGTKVPAIPNPFYKGRK